MSLNRRSGFLLSCLGLLASTSVYAAEAQTGWAINRVSSATAGSYCTMAQRYSDTSVFTVAKNPNGEYSVAFDFPKPVFKEGEAAKVMLTPDGGAPQSYQINPQNDKVAVVGLGRDESLVKALQSAGKLNVETGGKTFSFNTAQFSKASEELVNCVASMKGNSLQAPTTAAAAPVTAKELVQAPIMKAEAPPVAAPAPAPQAQIQAPVPVVDNSKVQELQDQNAQLKSALAESQKSYQQAASQGAAVSELQRKVQMLEQENANLKAQPKTDPKAAEEAARLSAELTKTRNDLSAAQAQSQQQITALQAQLTQATQQQQANAATAQQIPGLQKENADLKAQLDALNKSVGELKAQAAQAQAAQAQAQTAQAQVQATAQQTASIQQQVDTYKTQLDAANAQIGKLQADLTAANNKPAPAPAPAVPQVDPALLSENSTLKQEVSKLQEQLKQAQANVSTVKEAQGITPEQQERLAMIEKENAALKADLAKAHEDLKSAQVAQAAAAPQDENRAIREMRNQLELSQTENANLKKQLQEVQTSAENSNIKQTGNNWDLEQATRRYQEAQREIRRLGALIEQQEKKSEQEKRDIEAMLFDPAVASHAQVAMYNSLENRVIDLEGQLRASGIEPAPTTANIDQAELAQIKAQTLIAPAAGQASDNPSENITEVAAVDEEMLRDNAAPMLPEPGVMAKSKNELPKMDEKPAVMVETRQPEPAKPVQVAKQDAKEEKTEPLVIAKVEMNSKFRSQQEFASLVKAAGINAPAIEKMSGGDIITPDYQAYKWKTENLFGSVEQRALKANKEFEPAIQQYLARAKTRCGGEFAAVPAQISGGENTQGYEIACIGGKTDTSASVLFSFNDGVMTTIAHEGKADAMNQAIEARDRMAAQIGTIKTASK